MKRNQTFSRELKIGTTKVHLQWCLTRCKTEKQAGHTANYISLRYQLIIFSRIKLYKFLS